MFSTLSFKHPNNLNICEESVIKYFGKHTMKELKASERLLIDLLEKLAHSGISIFIFANNSGLNYELKDKNGNKLPGCQFYGTNDLKPSIILKTAIARAFYYINKQFKPQIELIK